MSARRSLQRTLVFGVGLGFVLTFFVDLAVLVVPIYDMQLYDRVLMSRNMDTLAALSLACLIGLGFYAALDFLRSACFAGLANVVAQRLHGRALDIGLRRSAAGDRRVGPQFARDVTEIQSFLSSGAVTVPLDACCTPMFVVILFILHPAYGYLSLAGITGLLLAGAATEFVVHPLLRQAHEQRRLADHRLSHSLSDSELMDGQGMLPAATRRWRSRYICALRQLCRAGARAQLTSGFARLLRFSMQAAVMAVGAVLIVRGDSTPGSLMGANLMLNKCLGPFDQLVESCRSWLLAADAWRRVAKLLPTISHQETPVLVADVAGLVVCDASLRLQSGQTLLSNIDLRLAPGTLALVTGPNGSGKTTLLRMLAGIVEPTTGMLALDGQPIGSGSNIGYLPQSIGLLDTTIAENIGRLAPDLEQVFEVSRCVGAHEHIGRLARGYETAITGDGASLSGGMRQRVGLARALYGAPRLVVLDEPDARLDLEGTTDLLRAIRSCCATGAIALISSHRRALRDAADVVFELSGGRLQELLQDNQATMTAEAVTS